MNATAPATDLSTLHPDPAAISAFAALVFGGMEGFVPVRMLREKGTAQAAPWSKYFPVNSQLADNLQQEAEKAASDGRGLFVVPGTVEKAGSAKAAEISETSVVVVDIDAGDIAAKHDHLVRYLGPAALEVASGGRTDESQEKLHLYWKLTTIARTAEVALVCRLRAVIALKAGGDPAFASAHQPIRVPGSIHGNQPRRHWSPSGQPAGKKSTLMCLNTPSRQCPHCRDWRFAGWVLALRRVASVPMR